MIEQKIEETLEDIRKLLICKNREYGNAYDNASIFTDIDTKTRLVLRIEEKLSRWNTQLNNESDDTDTITDLIGLFVHILIRQ